MKKLLLGLLLSIMALFFSNEVKASHAAGGEIYYEFVSANGNSETYKVFVFLYRDAAGIGMPVTVNVCASSSCGPSITTNFLQAPDPLSGNPSGAPVSNLNECALPASGGGTGGVNYELYVYCGTIVLPTKCVDWRFSYSLNARNSAIDNLQNPGSRNIYLEAKLNNTIGPNTSPKFVVPAIKRWCVVDPTDPASKPIIWSQASIEPNGDSIYYKFENPQAGPNCGPGTDLAYVGNYSLSSPMTTFGPIAINRRTGTFTFMPIQREIVVIRIDVDEYRFNTTLLRWEFVGSSMRDMQVAISDLCVNSIQNGDRLAFSAGAGKDSLVSVDSLRALGAINVNNTIVSSTTTDSTVQVQVLKNYKCNDASIILPFASPLVCTSADPTDFRIIGPDGIARPVTDINTRCGVDETTDTLELLLHQSLDVNGIYLLYIKRGNDGNTLTNRCGFELQDNIIYLINVKDCRILDYEMTNVTVVEDEKIKVEFDLNPNSFYLNTFNEINVLRANNDQNFQFIGKVTDPTAREFIDNGLTMVDVDVQAYQYIMQIVLNLNPRQPTNFINSILLQGDTLSESQFEMTWEPYANGTYGSPAEYEVFESDYDTTGIVGPAWTSVKKVGTDLTYVYEIPDNKSVWLKVQATDPSSTNTTLSNSNWIITGSYDPPVPPTLDPAVTYVPNIITPNGDNINDRFYFSLRPTDIGLREYSNLSLSIFNRWGKRVFQDDNYMERNNKTEGWDGTNDASGTPLADGVYFYVAKFSDINTGKAEEKNGTITLSASR